MQGFQMKVTPANERHIMLWFRTKCLPYIMEGQGRYVNGHRFCHHVAIALGKAGVDVDVSCTDRQLGGRPLPFRRCCSECFFFMLCISLQGIWAPAVW